MADPAQPTFGIGARLRAARYLAGFEKPEDMAVKLREEGRKRGRGLGRTEIYAAEVERKALDYGAIGDIANACGLPIEFFTADFARAAEISGDARRLIAEEQRRVEVLEVEHKAGAAARKLAKQAAASALPSPLGTVRRKAEARKTKARTQRRKRNPPEGDAMRGSDG